MIYCVFSVLGLAGAAGELCRARLCGCAAAQCGSHRAGLFLVTGTSHPLHLQSWQLHTQGTHGSPVPGAPEVLC